MRGFCKCTAFLLAVFCFFAGNQQPIKSQSLATPTNTTSTLSCSTAKLIIGLAFSPDSKSFLLSREPGQIEMWDLTGNLLQRFSYGEDYFSNFAFSHNGEYLLAGGSNEAILWDIHTGIMLKKFPRQVYDIEGTQVMFLADDKRILMGGRDGMTLMDINTGEQLRSFPGDMDSILTGVPQISPDGKYVMTSNKDLPPEWYLWDVETGKKIRTYKETIYARFTPDSQSILTDPRSGITLWNAKTGQKLYNFGAQFRLEIVVFSSDSRYMLLDDGMQKIGLWDIKNFIELHTFDISDFPYGFLPDNKHIFFRAYNNTDSLLSKITIWEINSQKQILELSTHDAFVPYIFSPDGKYWLTSTAAKEELWLWNIWADKDFHVLCKNND